MLAYGSWGLLPIYWKWLGQVPAVEVLSHRVIWSMVFLTAILLIQRRQNEFRQLWKSPRSLVLLLTTATLLSFNWGLYIYGVNTDRVVETSLGYYINPLMSVLLGCVALKERLSRGQLVAVALAAIAVINFVLRLGQVPWIALALATTFAFYGLLRKILPVAPMVGLAVETLLITPLALALVGMWAVKGNGTLGTNPLITLLFVGSGITTSLPLLWFNNAAHRLPLSTLGFFQYIAPSLQLGLGIFLYHEPFTTTHGITFGLIWSALAVYTTTSLRKQSRDV